MMRITTRVCQIGLAGLTILLALTACEDNKRLVIEDDIDDGDPAVRCPGQESPEAVLASLIDAYHDRDCDAYVKLLHSEFIFRFQDGDEPPELGREFWTFDEDSAGTCALLGSSHVSDIRLDLTYGDAAPADEIGLEHTMKIRIRPTKVDVDDVDGTTFRVDGDIQDMFFVTGADADSVCWYLVEWRDISAGAGGGGGGPGGGVGGSGAKEGASAGATWGRLKTQYR